MTESAPEANPRPRLLLDVDGVINAFPRAGRGTPWGTPWRRYTIRGYDFHVAGEVVDWLLGAHDVAEVNWLTTWEQDDWYLDVAQELGLPEWPVYARRAEYEVDDFRRWWKFDAVSALDDGRRTVWLDDDLRRYPSATSWARRNRGRVLAISPQEDRGLRALDLRKVEGFLATRPAVAS